MTRSEPPRLLIAVTSGIGKVLLGGQLAYAQRQGFDVYLLSSPDHDVEAFAAAEGATFVPVRMERDISLWRDCRALIQIVRALRRIRPTVVNTGTPKAGLLVTLAAWLCRVPCRFFTLRGLRSDSLTGMTRRIVWTMEWLSCRLAHKVICVSPSLERRAVELSLCPAAKTLVLGGGSSNGVNVDFYDATPERKQQAEQWRERLKLSATSPVVGYVGRIRMDKGIRELLDAWSKLRSRFENLQLLLVGPDEDDGTMGSHYRDMLNNEPSIFLTGHVDDPAPLYLLMDVLALPSYREGFGNVLLEAAAMQVPTVASRVAGCMDAVVDGVTGTLVPAQSAEALAEALERYLSDPALRRQHGEAGRERAVRDFRQIRVWTEQVAAYDRLMQQQLGWQRSHDASVETEPPSAITGGSPKNEHAGSPKGHYQ